MDYVDDLALRWYAVRETRVVGPRRYETHATARSSTKCCANHVRARIDTRARTLRPSVVGACAGVVAVPPVLAAGIQRLTIQPTAPAVTVPIAVVAGPPPDTGYEDAIAEVIVEVMVMGEVVVVMVVPIPMPVVSMPSMATIPGNVPTAAPAATAPVSTSDVASMPTAAGHATEVGNAGTTHASTKVGASTHSSEVTAAAATVSGVCLPHYDRSKKHTSCKSSYCNDALSHECVSPWARQA